MARVRYLLFTYVYIVIAPAFCPTRLSVALHNVPSVHVAHCMCGGASALTQTHARLFSTNAKPPKLRYVTLTTMLVQFLNWCKNV